MTTKRRVKIEQNANIHTVAGAAPAPVKVVAEAAGPVTFLDRVKGYYKALIALVGAILVIANELTPVLNFLPGLDKQYVTIAISAVTAFGVFLRDNEHWLDDL